MSFFAIGGSTSRKSISHKLNMTKVAQASASDVRKLSSFQGTRTVASDGGFTTSRYSPNLEQLDRRALIDDITPTSEQALMQLFKMIYERDSVAGPATDLISTIPWSDWSLSGIKDPGVMRVYEDALEMFDPQVTMPELTREYLMYGRYISSLLFNREQGTWTGMIPHDPTYCNLMPIPIKGFDPLVNVTASPEMRAFLGSKDKRLDLAKSRMPEEMRKGFLKEDGYPLDQFSTLFIPRRVTTTDWKGTSIFMRILPYFAIEKALFQSTISAARRRTRSILHVKLGIEGQWEPEPEDLESVGAQFQQSEEDPVGAIIVTRNGIDASEVRSGGDFWKISEEADFLRSGKMNSLGLSDSLLSGEASYSTMDANLSVFMENVKVLRSTMEKKTFEDKLFDILARTNNFVKRSEAERAHGVRIGASRSTLEEQMRIPKKDLMIPNIHWTKNLSPESDANYIEILKSVAEQGVPIPVKKWASAGGIDLNDLENMLEEDRQIRERLKKFVPKAPEGEGEGGEEFGAFSRYVDTNAVEVLGSFVDDDGKKRKTFFGVPYKEFRTIALELTENTKKMRILRDNVALSNYLYARLDSSIKVDAAKYMLTRMNLARCVVSDEFVTLLANKLVAACSGVKDKNKFKAIKTEAEILAVIHDAGKKVNKTKTDIPSFVERLREEIVQHNKTATTSQMYAGV